MWYLQEVCLQQFNTHINSKLQPCHLNVSLLPSHVNMKKHVQMGRVPTIAETKQIDKS